MVKEIVIEYVISIFITFIIYFINLVILIKLEKINRKEKLKKYINLNINKIHILFIIFCFIMLMACYVLFGLSFKIILNKIIYINKYAYIILLSIFSFIKVIVTTSILEGIVFKKYSGNIPFLLNNKYINFQIIGAFPIKEKIKFFSKVNLILNIIFLTYIFI